ncbi:MAG: aldo/keto reductase [Hyphomicrobiaceae bacterium]|nr:aldo/keto reductase [Hyphomicrobiaceae bacterium]
MHYTQLGRTGLTVSVASLGCGGNSRLGLGRGKSEADAIALVRAARDEGVTFFDTAEAYGTEEVLGRAFSPSERAGLVISTKSRILKGSQRMTAAEVVANLEASLKRLRTDRVEVFLLHGVAPQHYDYVRGELAPVLLAEKAKGKLGHLGLSETGPNDPEHIMLLRAVADPVWEVMMLAFHMMNQNARRALFPRAQAGGVGTLLMFVVRNIFSRPGLLAETVRTLAAEGKVSAELAARDNPLDFLIHPGGATSLIDAAYRFARREPGADVVLFGTSDIGHMRTNVASILAPPLPAADVSRLYELFGHLVGVGLDLPDNVKPEAKTGSGS